MNRRALGAEGEELAARLLSLHGYCLEEKNYRCPFGEIDLIAREGETCVFVEVKLRSSLGAGWPSEAVDPRKQQRIRRSAREYLYQRGISAHTPCRFDVLEIVGDRYRIIRNAF